MKYPITLLAGTLMFNATLALAHHPASDIVDTEIYAMIEDNISDTPHADLTFDRMLRDRDDAMSSRERLSDITRDSRMRRDRF